MDDTVTKEDNPFSPLSSYVGKWVVVFDGLVVAYGDDPLDVVNHARKQGIVSPHIVFVEDIPEGVARL